MPTSGAERMKRQRTAEQRVTRELIPPKDRPTAPPDTHKGTINKKLLDRMVGLKNRLLEYPASDSEKTVRYDCEGEIRLSPLNAEGRDKNTADGIILSLVELVRAKLRLGRNKLGKRKQVYIADTGEWQDGPWIRVYDDGAKCEQHADGLEVRLPKASTYSLVVCMEASGENFNLGTIVTKKPLTKGNSSGYSLATRDYILFQSRFQHEPAPAQGRRVVWAMQMTVE